MASSTENKRTSRKSLPSDLVTRIGVKVASLVKAEAVKAQADEALGFVKVETGYVLAEALRVLNGDSAVTKNVPQAVKDRILGFVTRKDLPTYSWDTVAAWIDAAVVESTLAEDQRGKLNSDALRTVKRFGGDTPSADDVTERRAFVKARLAKGETTVAAVRAAYKLAKPGKGSGEADPLKVAERIRKSEAVDWKNPQKVLDRNGFAVSLVMPMILFGVAIGQAFPKAEAQAVTTAINTGLKDGVQKVRAPRKPKVAA